MLKHNDLNVSGLIDRLMEYLNEAGYAYSTRQHLLSYYKLLIKYAEVHGIREFSLDIGKKFLLDHHGHQWSDNETLTSYQNYLQRHILILHEFQVYGEVRQKKRLKKHYNLQHFEDTLDAYLAAEQRKGLREATIRHKRHVLCQLFEYLEAEGLDGPQAVRAEHIYGFLASKDYLSTTTKEAYQYVIRSLTGYLCRNSLCDAGLARLFPVVSVHSKNAYPSYFTTDEVARMLACVDNKTPAGKRDYLVLLLAAGLGIRCGDICRLQMGDIDWNRREISFVQSKTGDSVTMSMTDEVFYALLDYMKNARPVCGYDEILICGRAPIRPFHGHTFHGTLQKYLHLAGIKPETGQKHGLHSLRSSLASNMLRDGTPMPVISNVLGHRYADTTSAYLKLDLDGLRRAALEVPSYE